MNPRVTAHVAAVLTILVWGATFVSTKVLLRGFSPVEILFLRFALGAERKEVVALRSCSQGEEGQS